VWFLYFAIFSLPTSQHGLQHSSNLAIDPFFLIQPFQPRPPNPDSPKTSGRRLISWKPFFQDKWLFLRLLLFRVLGLGGIEVFGQAIGECGVDPRENRWFPRVGKLERCFNLDAIKKGFRGRNHRGILWLHGERRVSGHSVLEMLVLPLYGRSRESGWR
jgi:hypothetical protein